MRLTICEYRDEYPKSHPEYQDKYEYMRKISAAKQKITLIIGILGCILFIIGDFLYAAVGPQQSSETIGIMIKAAYLDMSVRRMAASITCGIMTLLPWPINQLDAGSESAGHALVLVLGLVLLKEMSNNGDYIGCKQ